jgi:GAF domain-containing protein
VVAEQITDVLEADSCSFLSGPVYDARVAILDHDGVLTRAGRPVDVDRSGLPTDEYVAVPVLRGPDTVGHFLVTATSHATYPTKEQRRVAVLLADQVAVALRGDAP